MGDEALIATIRQRAVSNALRFESPALGATILARMRWDMPTSETVRGVSEADRTLLILRKTILHSHQVHSGRDQYGQGSWVTFARHVSEGNRRWDFEVDVTAANNDLVISNVRVLRPGDDTPDPNDPDSIQARTPLTEADLLPHGMIACPCCGHATLSERGVYQICPVCFWEDDGQDDTANLRKARINFMLFAANCDADREHVRPPTREEVKLRSFDGNGADR
jgi:cysteine-rich CPCC protein